MKRPIRLFLLVVLQFVVMSGTAQWQKITPNTGAVNQAYTSISYVSDSIAFLVGCSDSSSWNSINLYKTTDKGATWNHVQGASGGGCRLANTFLDKNTGYCILTYGTNQLNDIRKTSNGGVSWADPDTSGSSHIGSMYFYGAFYFVNKQLGLLSKNDTVLRTTNGGKSWQIVHVNHVINDFFFTSAQTGYAAGDHVIMSTNDGGGSWNAVNTGYSMRSLHFPSANVGYAVGAGGAILKSTDAGLTWNPQVSGVSNMITLRSVFCMDNASCYAVGEKGTILSTSNGGITWTKQNAGISCAINEIACTSDYCVAVADTSVILKTALATGIETNHKAQEALAVVPNPFHDEAVVKLSSDLEQPTLFMHDTFGRMVKRIDASEAGEIKLYREELQSGIYFIRLYDASGLHSTHKLLILD